MKYYVMPKNQAGQRTVISNGVPVNMAGVDVVELPDGDYLTVISRGREFPAFKIALAVAAGQVKIEDVK